MSNKRRVQKRKKPLKGQPRHKAITVNTPPRSPHIMATIKGIITAAHDLYQKGNYVQAEENYRKILDIDPKHVVALNNLALIHYQTGRGNEAIALWQMVITIKPTFADAYNNLGNAFKDHENNLPEAIKFYQQAVVIKPTYVSAQYNLGLALFAFGQLESAMVAYQKVIRMDSKHCGAYCSLGDVLSQQGMLAEAIATYQKVLTIDPNHAVAYNNLGIALVQLNQLDEGISVYQKALALKPDFAEVYNNLGNALRENGQLTQAIRNYQNGLGVKPDFIELYLNLGNALIADNRLEEAIGNLQMALNLKPDCLEALIAMYSGFDMYGKIEEAVAVLKKILAITPYSTKHCVRLADLSQELGDYQLAREIYQQALVLENSASTIIRNAMVLPVIYPSKEALLQEKHDFEQRINALEKQQLAIEDPFAEGCLTSFYLAYQGFNGRQLQKKLANIYLQACPGLAWTAPHCQNTAPTTQSKLIRIGFISAFFNNHTIGKLNRGIIRHLSRDSFETFVLRLPGKEDAQSRIIDTAADHVIHLPQKLSEARALVAAQQLDILFYLDIGMDCFTYFLAFSRLAPVQCVTWGHPVTTGIPNMDYFLSSIDLETENAQDCYTEDLVLLECLPTYYYFPDCTNISVIDRSRFNLPSNSNLYVCAQSLFKLHPDTDAVLGNLLRRDPAGRILIIEGRGPWTQLLSARLQRTFPDVVQRVCFLPRLNQQEFFGLLKMAHVLLDTPIFGGGSTSFESFAIGTPVVTWPHHQLMAGRVTYACYKYMGVMDLVAHNAEEYIDIAFRLANNKIWRDKITTQIQEKSLVLYENRQLIAELEVFFRKVVVTQ